MLIQIDEAHSSAWPIGLDNTPEPQQSFEERCERANKFVRDYQPQDPFIVKVDGWSNEFSNTFKAWPDKYYMIDPAFKILAKAEYGAKADALIDVDCIVHIQNIISSKE